jgi:hypothetical protein
MSKRRPPSKGEPPPSGAELLISVAIFVVLVLVNWWP